MYLSVCLFAACPFLCLSVCLSVHLCVCCLSISLSVCLSDCLFLCLCLLFVRSFIYLSVCCLSISLSVCPTKLLSFISKFFHVTRFSTIGKLSGHSAPVSCLLIDEDNSRTTGWVFTGSRDHHVRVSQQINNITIHIQAPPKYKPQGFNSNNFAT